MPSQDTGDLLYEPPLREFTALAIFLGIMVGLVMSLANVYLGLFAGMTVSASIPAAVISMGLLKGVFKRGTIHENNIVQTVASAGESLAAGIIFTMPALVIAGVWSDFDFWTTTLVSMTGGMLGVLFMIPLRRPMIVEDPDLIYPEGVACGKVLRAGEEGGAGMKMVFGALGLGALIKVLIEGISLVTSGLKFAFTVGSARVFTGILASPALVAVGFIVGFNIATLVFLGGAISWFGAAPYLTATTEYLKEVMIDGVPTMVPVSLEDPALEGLVKADVRFLGVGAMIVGGLWSIIQIRKGIAQGVRETFGSYRAAMDVVEPPKQNDQDMERKWLLLLMAATMMVVLFLYFRVTDNLAISALATPLMVVCSFFFVAVASYIVGLVGSSNSPVSGMTICSVLLTSGVIAMFGYSGELAILATMGVAGVVCCATCTSGDVCQDLKTGNIVGATPFRQQWAEVIGVLSASFVMAPVLGLLHRGYGIGTDAHLEAASQGNALEAPQAQLFASLMNGFFGELELPWMLIGAGAVVGLAIILVDQLVLLPKRSKFRLFLMPVAVGMYLPLGLSVAILVGGIIAWLAGRAHTDSESRERGHERGVLLSSGLIAGEAIAGVLIAIPMAAKIKLPDMESSFSPWLTLVSMLVVASLLVRAGTAKELK
ncbi:MAG: oligopeptide transporter, OPT family [Planctomycetota bacterium]|jgi:putative OPT family oligopeptide transporter|nr:oligopeptide transporter, OPT family [Planctomycetota bacterium]